MNGPRLITTSRLLRRARGVPVTGQQMKSAPMSNVLQRQATPALTGEVVNHRKRIRPQRRRGVCFSACATQMRMVVYAVASQPATRSTRHKYQMSVHDKRLWHQRPRFGRGRGERRLERMACNGGIQPYLFRREWHGCPQRGHALPAGVEGMNAMVERSQRHSRHSQCEHVLSPRESFKRLECKVEGVCKMQAEGRIDGETALRRRPTGPPIAAHTGT